MTRKLFNGSERRAYVRLETSLPVRFKISGKEMSKMSKIYTAITKNISHGGLCLEVHQDKEELIDKLSADCPKLGIELDTLISDEAPEASAKPAWVSSRIDWTRKPKSKDPVLLMGLEFENLTQEARKKIHGFLVGEFVNRYEENN
jgi:c-di-GMP-binding flagellar brake protein YcgR